MVAWYHHPAWYLLTWYHHPAWYPRGVPLHFMRPSDLRNVVVPLVGTRLLRQMEISCARHCVICWYTCTIGGLSEPSSSALRSFLASSGPLPIFPTTSQDHISSCQR